MVVLFLCHHSKYSCGFLHTVKIIHMELKIYNAMMKFLFSFLNAMLMQKSKYAKGKIIHAILKVNIDNYQFYLLARVQCFKSSEQDLIEEVLYFLGASIGLGDGDLDGCTSCDGDSNDDVTFSFQTCLV